MYFLNKKHSQKIKKIEVLGIWCYNTVGDNMKIINRKDYINKLIALKNKPDIKIITGVRRAGKSVLLNEFSKYILSVEQYWFTLNYFLYKSSIKILYILIY